MAAHTPGPWSTSEWRLQRRQLAGGVGFECSVHGGAPPGQPGNALALVYLGGEGALKADRESVYANALLIAAAPELADALEALLLHADAANMTLKEAFGIDPPAEPAVEAARAALAKAGRLP